MSYVILGVTPNRRILPKHVVVVEVNTHWNRKALMLLFLIRINIPGLVLYVLYVLRLSRL